jgi:hypothetical protein
MQGKEETLEDMIESKTREIKLAMSSLGRRLEQDDNSEILHWVIPGKLACAHRPLRHHPLYGGSGKNLAKSASGLVRDWAEDVMAIGIRSIMSLMHDKDLACYAALDLRTTGLLEYYKNIGLQVAHIPWEDPHHKKSAPEQKREMLLRVRKEALSAYVRLDKPALLQCSAGIDRSSPVAAFVWVRSHNETQVV